jgi:glycosyltransferase involved in cell wall biosynthesis
MHRMMQALSVHNRVLFVDPPVALATLLAHPGRLAEIRRAIALYRAGPRRLTAGLWVYRPPPLLLPLGHLAIADRANRRRLTRALSEFLRQLGCERPIIWAYDPFAIDPDGGLEARLLVYDCNDDISSFARFGYKRDNLRRQEQAFCARADLVLATSRALLDEKKRVNPNSHYFPSGVDFDQIQEALATAAPLPAEVEVLPGPRIGYLGSLTNYRIAWDWILALARAHPGWSIVLVGPWHERPPAKVLEVANIHCIGARPPRLVPGYLKSLDVGIIPYQGQDFLSSCQPTKTFEYLAAGKPVVSAAIPELAVYPDLIELVSSARDFVRAVERAVDKAEDRALVARRIEAARAHTWTARIEGTSALIERLLVQSAGSSAG